MQRISFVCILWIFLIFTYCNKSFEPVEESFTCNSEDNPFNLIFKYGVTANNILNTFDCTYQKDMVMDPPVIIKLKLTEEELDSIFVIMQSIDFFEYPDTFFVNVQSGTIGVTMPSSKYYFYVKKDSISKKIYWDDSIVNPDDSADELRRLNKYIMDSIKSKEDYAKLPNPRGSYQ